MKLVIQKVKKAKVEVKNNVVGQIDKWYLVSERSKTDLFPADLLLRLLCPWLSLLDAVSASVF